MNNKIKIIIGKKIKKNLVVFVHVFQNLKNRGIIINNNNICLHLKTIIITIKWIKASIGN